MIVVIADDITGAAEIAALGWRRGLSTQVQMTPALKADADVLVVDTDTRSVTRDVARNTLTTLSDHIRAQPIQWCFKKVDSVLRGNVAAELEALMEVLGKRRTLLAPANPSKGRVIADGRYYVDGIPLDETEFAHDPEHPARSSLVTDLMNASKPCRIHVLSHAAYTGQETGLVVAQAKTTADLARWAECLDEHTLAAGGADFFHAIAEKRLAPAQRPPSPSLAPTGGPSLFVCGSRSEASRRAVAEASRRGVRVCPMPEALFQSHAPGDEHLLGSWAGDIVAALAASGCAIVAIGQADRHNAPSALDIRTQMAALVQQVVGRICLSEVLIEGGATAGAILRRLGWNTLDVIGEYGPGVVRLGVKGSPGQTVTLKPGSYPWPERIWTLT